MSIESIRDACWRVIAVLKQDKKRLLLLCGAAALLTVLLLWPNAEKRQTPAEQAPPDTARTLEASLCALLCAMEGVEDARVMLCLASSGETVYAADTDSTAETRDGQTSQKEKTNVVIVKNAQGEGGLVVRTAAPAVTGAAVVCKGGGDPVIRERIVQTISALFGLSSNHISVMPM